MENARLKLENQEFYGECSKRFITNERLALDKRQLFKERNDMIRINKRLKKTMRKIRAPSKMKSSLIENDED